MRNRLESIKKRTSANGPGITIAVIALILALAGGAFAASGALTKKQKKEVEKIAKKFAGKDGVTGVTGPQGPIGSPGTNGSPGAKGATGATGDTGATGEKGTTGANGTSVVASPEPEGTINCNGIGGSKFVTGTTETFACNGKEGEEGEKGEKGEKGEPWTPNNTLPAGAVETGSWSFSRSVETITTEVEGKKEEVKIGDSERILVPISFPIELKATLAPSKVHYQTDANFSTFCPLAATNPAPANNGELCVYVNNSEPVSGTTFLAICQPANKAIPTCLNMDSGPTNIGANRPGAVLVFEKPSGDAQGSGTFGVKGE